MGATYSRVKNWVVEILTNTDLNAEIDNILTNHTPAGMDDYSTNVTEMQTKTDPGEVGSESLATSLAGELERLRQMVSEITGKSQWYETPNTSLNELNSAVGGGLPANRISSGKVSSLSQQPQFLKANGSATTIRVEGATTTLSYVIAGSAYTITTDLDATGLVAAPSSNNTALLDDPSAGDEEETKRLGMYGSEIHMDTVGSEISGKVGDIAAFKINDGSADEYFIAKIHDATTLVQAQRGYFWNSSGTHVPALAVANNDTITLLKLTWVFAKTDSTLAVVYNQPRYGPTEPGSPAVGDYWFDTTNELWKSFNSTIWVDSTATLIGVCAQDGTNTICARSFDFFLAYEKLNNLQLTKESASQIRTDSLESSINLNGTVFRFDKDHFRWDFGAELETGESEAANSDFYYYITETGLPKISTKPPLELIGTRRGFYHPGETWRCVGRAHNDGSSNLTFESVLSTSKTGEMSVLSNNLDRVGTVYTRFDDFVAPGELELTGTITVSRYQYAELFDYLGTNVGEGDAADTFHLPDVDAQFLRAVDNGAAVDPDAAGRTAMNTNGNTGDNVGSVQAEDLLSHTHTIDTYTGSLSVGTKILNTDGLTGPTDVTSDATGGNETRPTNMYVKLFYKVEG